MYNYVPGMKAAPLYHDVEMKNAEQPALGISIPSSFANTYYSLLFKNLFNNKEK